MAGSFRALAVAGLLFVSVALSPPTAAGAIELAWDPVPGAAGYKIYYGTASGQYTASRDFGNTTRATLSGLTDCTTWYLALKAYNSAGESPDYSNEISGWSRPVINPQTISEMQGAQFTLDLLGNNFQSGASLEVDNPNVFLGTPSVSGCNRIQAAVTIEPTADGVRPAEVGQFRVTVINPDLTFGERSSVFEVRINPARFDVVDDQGASSGRLDGRDAISIARLFGSREGGSRYDPDNDFDGDGWVDGQDLSHLAGNLGKCWSGASWLASACPESLR